MTVGLANVGKKLASGAGRVGAGAKRIGISGAKAGLRAATSRGVATSRAGLAAVGIGAFGLGLMNKAAPAARDAAFDVAFDDPNADVAFTGRKMSTRFLMGTAIGGPMGGALRYSAPGDLMAVNPVVPLPTARNMVGVPAAFGLGGIAAGLKYGKGAKGKAIGAIVGGMGGAFSGATIGATSTVLGTRSHIRNNQQFYSESPYTGRTSSSIASSMNSSGDIVLGMHNARRGY